MYGIYDNIKIQGISVAVPEHCVENAEYYNRLGEKKVKKQMKQTGMERLHIAGENDSTEELCFQAAETLLNQLQWDREKIQALILVTQTPGVIMPALSFILQSRLKIGENCMVFDINLGCSGYVAGLQTVAGLLQQCGEGARGLLLVGDTVSKTVEESDIQTRMIFGDGASATALEIWPGNQMYFMQKSNGSQYDKIFMKDWNDYFHMDGMAVFHFTINQVVAYIKEFKSNCFVKEEEIDFYVFHQAQKYIIDNLIDFAQVPEEKVLNSYKDYGNTAGASIPISLWVNRDKILALRKEQINVLMCGFGVGLSCGCVMLKLNAKMFA